MGNQLEYAEFLLHRMLEENKRKILISRQGRAFIVDEAPSDAVILGDLPSPKIDDSSVILEKVSESKLKDLLGLLRKVI